MNSNKFYIASENLGKVTEIEQFLKDENIHSQFKIFTLKNLTNEEIKQFVPVEDGDSFLENAKIKARALYNIIKQPVLADDSGLEVDILNGEPGIYSSRYEKTDELRIKKLTEKLSAYDQTKRSARFVSCICYKDHSGNELFFNGTVEGYIVNEPAGKNGFGYDPVFYYPPLGKTFGQLLPEEKLKISHRSNALRLFIRYLKASL
jgi:XTP/dITP diphosphohydrolase